MPVRGRIDTSNENYTNSEKSNMSSRDISGNSGVVQFNPIEPKYTLDDIILSTNVKNKILDALVYKDKCDLVFNEWGLCNTHKYCKKIGINLYGEPGTGKTMAAHAIAKYMGKKIIEVSYADIESKYVGDTPKNLTRVFEQAQKTDSVLFFDEADAILSRRVTNMNNSTDVSVNQTRSVMLMLMNDYQGVIIFATNFIQNFDPAFMRRIMAHIHFQLPNFECRKKIWTSLIPKQMPNNLDIECISEKYEGISGSDISNAILMAAFKGARTDEGFVENSFFEEAIEDIITSKRANSDKLERTMVEDRIVSKEYALSQINKLK